MRHLKAGRKFGRTSAHRKALFRNLVTALLQKERIRTTLPKAKELRSKVEKTITLGKKGTLHARRLAFKTVMDKETLQKLFGPIAEKYANRNGGYTRIIKIGNRPGDDAPMAFIELVEQEKAEKPKEKKAVKAKAKAPKADSGEKKTEKKEPAKKAETTKKATTKKAVAEEKAEPKKTVKKAAKKEKEEK
jgi:large subunit ribosomal protein L17